jgi:putative adenylate-forming enzyme
MHLHEESIYFEKRYLDKEQKRFVPIITDFTRESQAFVRYELNDILHSSSEKCPCGSAAEVIEKIEGRMDDVFYLQDFLGQEQAVFPDFFRDIFSSCSRVQRYRLEQKSRDSLVFKFEGKLDFKIKQELLKKFEDLWKTLRIKAPQISFVEHFSFPQDQKHRRIARAKSLAEQVKP